MPEVSNQTEVAAPLETVYAAALDIEGLAGYISDVESIQVLSREERPGGCATETAWVGLLPEFRRKLHWTEADEWDDAAHRCTFRQVKGDFDQYEGEWLFAAAGEGTAVSLTVRYEYDIPLVGPLLRKLVRRKVQQSVDAIQAGLKRRAEGDD